MEHEIKNVALLDLTGAAAANALEGVTRIANVAAILVSESLLPRLSSIALEKVAATIPIPDGQRVRVFTGQVTLSGEALGPSADGVAETLVVTGQLILTSPVGHVGRNVVVIGQVVAPTGSETGLGAGLSRLTGQVTYYPYVEGAHVQVREGGAMGGEALANVTGQPTDILLVTGALVLASPVDSIGYQHVVVLGDVLVARSAQAALLGRVLPQGGQIIEYDATPQVFRGDESLSAGYFELLDAPITLVIQGKCKLEDDISPALLRQKVAGLVLQGKLTAPRRLLPVLQIVSLARR